MVASLRWILLAGVLTLGACTPLPSKTPQAEKPSRSGGNSSANVRDFGAIGDGVTDDTQAIAKALTSGRGHVVFPKGIYRIAKTITVDLDQTGYLCIDGLGVAELVMTGPGPALRIVGTHSKSADPGGFEPRVWQNQRMPMVERLGIRGDHPEADGIEADGTMQLTVDKVHIRNCRHGIHLVNNNRNVLIANCHIYENRGIGIYYDNVNLHQSNIVGCHISYCDRGGIVSRQGNVRNIHISGCDLESNMSPDQEPTANVLIDCRESQYGTAEVAVTGCTIQHNNPSPGSANIRILGESLPGRQQQRVREGNVTITGNVLSDVKVNIHLDGCRGVAISGNTLWQGYQHNLLIQRCHSVVIGSNNLDRNPRYNYGNTQDANNGVVLEDCEDCSIVGLHLTQVWREPAGMILRGCRRMLVAHCTLLDCEHAGLLLENCERTHVSGCLIDHQDSAQAFTPILERGGTNNQIQTVPE